MIIRKGLSGITMEINTAYCDAGRLASIIGDGNLTGQTVFILGSIPRNYVTVVAVELSDGRATAIAPDKLELIGCLDVSVGVI